MTFRAPRHTDDLVLDPDKQCVIGDCRRRKWARGYCPSHYRRWSRYGDPGELKRPPRTATPCSIDGCETPHEARGLCKVHYLRQHRAEHPPAPESHRKYTRRYLLAQYGLTIADYEAMLQKQGGRCAICRDKNPGYNGHVNYSWCVDHDHVTDQIRGLLCRSCNVAIGLLKDDPNVVRAAAKYIQRHRQLVLSL